MRRNNNKNQGKTNSLVILQAFEEPRKTRKCFCISTRNSESM